MVQCHFEIYLGRISVQLTLNVQPFCAHQVTIKFYIEACKNPKCQLLVLKKNEYCHLQPLAGFVIETLLQSICIQPVKHSTLRDECSFLT